MKITRHLHHTIWIKNLLITWLLLCLLGLSGWLSTQFKRQSDWTANSRNSLSAASQNILSAMPADLDITVYMRVDKQLKTTIKEIIKPYQSHKKNLKLKYITPESQPEKLRQLGIGKEGAIILTYQGRTEKLISLNESSLTNALLRLTNAKERWVTFLSGHDERSPNDAENHDLSQFVKQLEQRNIKVHALNLAALPAIPDNSSLLVIASPRYPFLEGENEIILQYIIQGGNLLWLTDPNNKRFNIVNEILGINHLPGTIVDTGSQLYGVDSPTFIIANQYPHHAITQGFSGITIFPVATALVLAEETDYKAEAIINSAEQSWTETGALDGGIHFDADSDEREGPLAIAFALTRQSDNKKQQRIIVIGDGDFLSNAFMSHVGNLDLGLRMINWLTHNDHFIDIPAKTATDQQLHLSKLDVTIIAFGFLIVLPLLFFAIGFLIWRRRKRR